MELSGNSQPAEMTSTLKPISGELLSVILDSFDGIVYVADLDTSTVLFANSYLKKMFGFDPTGHNCSQLLHSSHGEAEDFCDNSLLLTSNGTPGDARYREFQNPANKRWYAAKAQAIEWSDDRYVRLEIALDITEHKRLQKYLDEARKQAESAINTKNRFLTIVAHDLKSPFVSILGMIQRILRKETFAYEVHRRFLENIMKSGQRTLTMIDNLLDMDRLETGKIKPEHTYFNLSEIVGEVFDNFTHLAELKNLRFENRVPVATEIFADRDLYFVVLNNLISNAVKFSFSHGRIEVSCDESEDYIRLIVRDQGKGIPETYIKDIFKPDVKTTSPGTGGETGSGLGLVFCQQIMKAHGGRILLESIEGKGATFYVELASSCRLPDIVSDDSGKSAT